MSSENVKLQKDIDVLKDDIKNLTETIKQLASQKVEEQKTKLLDDLDVEELKNKVEELKSKGENSIQEVEKKVKEDPLKSLAVTFGVGFLAAWMLRK